MLHPWFKSISRETLSNLSDTQKLFISTSSLLAAKRTSLRAGLFYFIPWSKKSQSGRNLRTSCIPRWEIRLRCVIAIIQDRMSREFAWFHNTSRERMSAHYRERRCAINLSKGAACTNYTGASKLRPRNDEDWTASARIDCRQIAS